MKYAVKYSCEDILDLECILDNTSLELDHIRLFSFQLLRAVNFIHSAHIIHRDIQMSNVFINVDTLMLKVNYLSLGGP